MSLAVPAIPTPYIHSSIKRRKNVWVSAKDGNWTDPTCWESNESKRFSYPGLNIPAPLFPQVGDDIYISHTITFNAVSYSSVPLVINNFYISGTLLSDAGNRYLLVNGDIQVVGSIDFTSSNINMTLNGINNYITNFTKGTSTIVYNGAYGQNIMNLSYYNLTTTGLGKKYLISDLTISHNLVAAANTDIVGYNLTVNGTTTAGAVGGTVQLLASGSGIVTFVGQLILANGYSLNFSAGNPTVFVKGGISATIQNTTRFNSGTGTWTFSTNNQTILYAGGTSQLIFNAPILISGAITLTIDAGWNSISNYVQFNGVVTGDSSSSKLLNKGYLNIGATTLPMASLGVFDYATYANSLGFAMNGNFTIPNTPYSSIYIYGTGTKTISGNMSLPGNLVIGSASGINPILELSIYTLTVTGTTTLGTTSLQAATLSNTGGGNVLFIGAIIIANQNSNAISFGTGNPNVELRGGIQLIIFNTSAFNSGTGNWTFSTNNQTVSCIGICAFSFSGTILISGAITLVVGSIGYSLTLTTLQINGDNASSILDNRGGVHYQSATAPMVTGKLYTNQAANTWLYDLVGGQDIQVPSDATPGYSALTLAGSGAKKLLGNVSVKGTYVLGGSATLNSNGFTLSNP